jgi:hypothetical protein
VTFPPRRNRKGTAHLHQLWVGATRLTNGFSEWIGHRGAFASDAIACGVLLLGPDTEYPDHSHEAEELYFPLAGHVFRRSAQSG